MTLTFGAVMGAVQPIASTADDTYRPKEVAYLSKSRDVLSYFSDCALLIDRGITNSPFAGSAEEFILESLVDSSELRRFLGISDAQFAASTNTGITQSTNDSEESRRKIDFDWDDEYALEAQNRLNGLVSDRQKMKLPILYLNFEGLLALRRHQFNDLIGISLDEQKMIVKLAKSYVDSKSATAKVLHRNIFTLRNEQLHLLPKLNLQLRQLSSELDHKIANMLTEAQRERLATIITQATQVTDLIQGPGVDQPWRSTLRLVVPNE